jgi:hypothetical protein
VLGHYEICPMDHHTDPKGTIDLDKLVNMARGKMGLPPLPGTVPVPGSVPVPVPPTPTPPPTTT